jgi:hypothetical protein
MAWWAGAKRLELQPESDDQPAIVPTQLIAHSLAAPWTPGRTYEYWRDSTNLESHLAVGYDGSVAQFIGTQTRADANAGANLRADGTGAVSVETASNLDHTDPWTGAQIETLIRFGAWVHETHPTVPLRLCRTHSDPGYGWHSMFPQWSSGGTKCPGGARIAQFKQVVFPGIVARVRGETVALTDAEIKKVVDGVLAGIARAAWLTDGVVAVPPEWTTKDNPQWAPASILLDEGKRVRGLEAGVRQVLAQGAAQDAVLAKLVAGGGLTVEEAKAAAEAGARAALDVLGDALQTPGG